MEDRTVDTHGCQKTKKLLCGMEEKMLWLSECEYLYSPKIKESEKSCKHKIVNKVTEVTKGLPPRFPRSQYDFKEELEKVAEYGDVPKDIFRELLKF